MATYNFMNEQVTTDANNTPVSTAPILSSTTNSSGSLSNVQTGTAVPVSSLQQTEALKVPAPTPQADALQPATASATETTKSLEQYIKELTPPQTETSKQYDALSSEISKLLPSLTGRGEAQLTAEKDAGLPDLKKKLADINAQLLMKVAEATKSNTSYEQLIANLENPANAQQQGIPMSAIIGQQAQARKMQLAENNAKAADIGLLQAFALGLQGQVQAAQQSIDRAIDLRYQDRESTLNLKMQQLGLLEGKLSKEEAIVKQALERKYNEEQQRIAEEKAKAKENINLAFNANVQTRFVNKNGEFFDARTGQGYSDPASFFKAAGVKSFEEAYKRGLVTDVTPERLADIEFVTQLRAKYPDAGIAMGDSITTAQQKLSKSRIYQDQVRGPVGSGGGATGLAGAYIVDSATDAGVKAIIASRPGDKGYGDAYKAVAAKYGSAVANMYDKVYQSFFNSGATIDAAFNNAKLGAAPSSAGPTDVGGKPVKLGVAQQANVADWNTLVEQIDKTSALGERIKWKGIGGLGKGTVSQFAAKNFGKGTPEQEELRNLISNVRGTLAKARGGTSFTANEEKLLNSYVPTINEDPLVTRSKLKSLRDFAQTNIQKTYQSAGAVNFSQTSSSDDPYAAYLKAIGQ